MTRFTIANIAQPNLRQESYFFSVNNDINTDTDLRRTGSSPTNLAPCIVPFSSVTTQLILNSRSEAVNWSLELLVNDVVAQTFTKNNGLEVQVFTPSISLSQNDELRFRFITGGTLTTRPSGQLRIIEVLS